MSEISTPDTGRLTEIKMVIGDLTDPQVRRLLQRHSHDGDHFDITAKTVPNNHAVTITVEYRTGAYRVARVAVAAQEGKEITSVDLSLPVKEAAEKVIGSVWSMFGLTADYSERLAEFDRRQRKRGVDDAFLRRVADVYKTAEAEGAPSVIQFVADHFSGAYSSAQRWVAAAREREFLPHVPRGGRRKGGS